MFYLLFIHSVIKLHRSEMVILNGKVCVVTCILSLDGKGGRGIGGIGGRRRGETGEGGGEIGGGGKV